MIDIIEDIGERARKFVFYWTNQTSTEREHAQTFWNSLLQDVLMVKNIKEQIRYEVKVSLNNGLGFIDALIPKTQVLIEQKSSNINLDLPQLQSDGTSLTPFEQALRYKEHLPESTPVRFIVLCNFREFRIYDLAQTKKGSTPKPVTIALQDFVNQVYRLTFLANPAMLDKEEAILPIQTALSIRAAQEVGKLYSMLVSLYQGQDQSLVHRSVNKLCVRLVFCWYADDAGLFNGSDRFHHYLESIPTKYWYWGLLHLFQVLDTPTELRNPNEFPALLEFPYVDGGLFHDADQDPLPQFNAEVRNFILYQADAAFNWSEISPTIFGAVFESTLNPESRRLGGMHYTSIDNIHKVIDPLFLDELKLEFTELKEMEVSERRIAQLSAFQHKLASLTFLDPACGSGNFLTETYLSLRRLENDVIREIYANQSFLGIKELTPVKVSLSQFAGIEINSFAASVAKTALWIAEGQMLQETIEIIHTPIKLFPLKHNNNIIEGNALTMPWEDVISIDKLDYIIGNPPFSGARLMSRQNKQDLKQALGSDWPGKIGDLDFVCGWFKKAHDIMRQAPHVKTAFVATNSICQGTSITNL